MRLAVTQDMDAFEAMLQEFVNDCQVRNMTFVNKLPQHSVSSLKEGWGKLIHNVLVHEAKVDVHPSIFPAASDSR